MSEPIDFEAARTLRTELQEAQGQLRALNAALVELPEVPPLDALLAIERAAMRIRSPDVLKLGKALQDKHGTDAIPEKAELECAAGLWSIIRAALVAARG